MTDNQKILITVGIKDPVRTESDLVKAASILSDHFLNQNNDRYCYRISDKDQRRLSEDKFYRELGEASTALWESLPDDLKPIGMELIFKIWDYIKERITALQETETRA